MSLNNTAVSDPPTQPLVIPVYGPEEPASAIGRWLSDMVNMGQVDFRRTSGLSPDDSGSRTIVDRGNRHPQDSQITSDADTTTSSTDMERRVSDSSQNTSYSSDFAPNVPQDDYKGIVIGVGNRAGSVFTRGKGVTLEAPGAGRDTPPHSQRYWMIIEISEQPVADVDDLREILCGGGAHLLDPVAYKEEVDCGSNTTWFLGYNYGMAHGPLSTGGWGIRRLSGDVDHGERPMIYDHAYVHGPENPPHPDNCPTSYMLMYADGNGVGVFMHKEMTLNIPCFNWVAKSWGGSMTLRYKPAVANAVMGRWTTTNTSGLVGLGPSRFQTIFGNSADRIQAPSLLEALRVQNRLPATKERGTIIYCAFRPMVLYEETDTGYHVLPNEPEHWLAVNGWPCARRPPWSKRIYVEPQSGMLDKHWKIRLLSMSFELWNSDTRAFDKFAAPLTFGDGLIVHLDFGTSVTIVPSYIVCHIRTSLFPTVENLAHDNEQQDQPCDPKHPVLPFTVPGHLGANVGIRYRFADGRGGEVEIFGPGINFLGQPNPEPSVHRQTKDREGLVFAGSTNLVGDGALFGLNFFQSMFGALHNPLSGNLYVELAPQWDAQRMWYNLVPQAD